MHQQMHLRWFPSNLNERDVQAGQCSQKKARFHRPFDSICSASMPEVAEGSGGKFDGALRTVLFRPNVQVTVTPDFF